MNKKGFTLIELLAVIVLIGLVGIIVVPNVADNITISKDKSYEMLISNIKTAAQTYYEECEYGDLKKRSDKYCKFNDDKNITVTLGDLVNAGMLSASEVDKTNEKIIKDSKKNESLNGCEIIITKNVNRNSKGIVTKVSYTVTDNTKKEPCPTSY